MASSRVPSSLDLRSIVLPPSIAHGHALPASKRTTQSVKFGRIFTVDELLTPEECASLVRECERIGFHELSGEYPADFRNNSRVLVSSPVLAEKIWERLKGALQKEDVVGVRPYGFDGEGSWFPVGLNDCFKFSRYISGVAAAKAEAFAPHYDGVFVRSPDEKSVYTVLAYLSDEFSGGQTRFYHPRLAGMSFTLVLKELFPANWVALRAYFVKEHKYYFECDVTSSLGHALSFFLERFDLTYSRTPFPMALETFGATMQQFLDGHFLQVTPTTGRVVVFNHDVLHEGVELNIYEDIRLYPPRKYVFKSELMFKRSSAGTLDKKPTENPKWMSDSNYIEAVRLYDESEQREREGDVEGSLRSYLEAQRLQLMFPTFTSPVVTSSAVELPLDILVLIFRWFSVAEIGRFALVSRHFEQASRSPLLWHTLFVRHYPGVAELERSRDPSFMVDWYSLFRARHELGQTFSAVVVDVGSCYTKFGRVGYSTISSMPSLAGNEHHPHYNVPGRSYGEMFIFGYQIAMGDDVGLKEIFKFDYDNKTMTVCEGYAFQRFFEHIYKEVSASSPAAHPLIIATDPLGKKLGSAQQWAKLMKAHNSEVKLLCFVDEPVLAALANKLNTAVVVHIGNMTTYVAVVHQRQVLQGTVVSLPFSLGIVADTFYEMTGIRRSDIREKVAGETILFAHVAAVFDSPPKGKPSDYSPDDFRWISDALEPLFYANLTEPPSNETLKGLQGAVVEAILRSPVELRPILCNNILVTGGGAGMRYMAPRLELELKQHAALLNGVKVRVSDEPELDIVRGGLLFAQGRGVKEQCLPLSSFSD